MRRFLGILSLLAVSVAVMGVPAKRGLWKTVRLADGSEVRVELRGDEFGHFWQAADGAVYVQNEASDIYERADKAALLREADVRRAKAAERRGACRAGAAIERAPLGSEHTPFTGTKKGLVILVEFADVTFAEGHDRTLYNRIANEAGFTSSDGFVGSVRDYFEAQSGGQFTLDFDVVGPVVMPNGHSYYGSNDFLGNDRRVGTLVVTACQGVDDEVNFADYDWDGDGEVDQVFVLYAGRGEASGGGANTIWPHESELRYTDYGKALTLDGVKISTYACSNEMQSETLIDGIGTICHEFAHCLGLPDMYDTAEGGNFGMGPWDLMDQGNYLGDAFVPCSFTSYERMYCGWLEPVELTGTTEVSGMKALSDGGEAYIMYNEGNRNEYYLLENRAKTGWDAELYGSGLLVLHVDFDSQVWANNYVNTTAYGSNDHQRCTIFHADGSDLSTTSGLEGDPYPYGSNNCISAGSQPSAALYNANADGSLLMDKSILNITRNTDGTVSFTVKKNSELGENRPEGAVFYESFDICSSRGGNDGFWRSTGLKTGGFVADNAGWTSDECHGGWQCARFGSATVAGRAVTPAFNIDGATVITFRAGMCIGDGTDLTLTVSEGDATLSETTFTLSSMQWSDFSTVVTGHGQVRIEFAISSGRLYLDEIAAVPAGQSSVAGIKGEPAATDNRIYTLDGRYVGTDTARLPKGVYIKGGKKFVKI